MTERLLPAADPVCTNVETSSDRMPDIEIDPIEFGRSLLRHRRLIIRTTLAAMVFTAAVMFMMPNKYTSHASILPSGNEEPSFGLDGPGGNLWASLSEGRSCCSLSSRLCCASCTAVRDKL